MISNECYPSSVFLADGKLVITITSWQSLQKYIADIQTLLMDKNSDPPLPHQTQDILIKLHDAAQDLHSNVLPKANELMNSLYNFGSTATATFEALKALMSQSEPPRNAIENLIESLRGTAIAAQEPTAATLDGLKNFGMVTADGGKVLTSLLGTAKNLISKSNKTILSAVQDIEKQLAVTNPNVTAIHADIQKIKQSADTLAGVQLTGLTFPVDTDTALSAQREATANVSALYQAWSNLANQLTDLLAKVTDDKVDLQKEPCLTELQLTGASRAWSKISAEAHEHMLNFYMMPE